MADIAFTNATARRDAVALELNTLQQRMDELRREAKHIDDWLDGYRFFSKGADETQIEPKVQGVKRNPPKETIADYAYKLILARGRPVPRSYIMAALKNDGIELEGKDPEMVLSTMLWRMSSKIVRLRKFGYWMTDKDFPEADYKANSPENPDDTPAIDDQEEPENHSYARSPNNPGMTTVAN